MTEDVQVTTGRNVIRGVSALIVAAVCICLLAFLLWPR
jgi:hypothetical protein